MGVVALERQAYGVDAEVASMKLNIDYGKDREGRHTATSRDFRGLLARGKSDAEAAHNLMKMVELIELRRGHADAAPSAVIYDVA